MYRLVSWLIRRAARHPYYHLTRDSGEVYMKRWWLFGHGTDRDRDDRLPHKPMLNPMVDRFSRWFAKHLFVLRVHHILDSDLDRDLHDHPGWSISVVLRGGYWELKPRPFGSRMPFEFLDVPEEIAPASRDLRVGEPCVALWRGPGAIVIRRAHNRHKIVLPEGATAWSLFAVGKKSNEWGFYVGGQKIPWRQYRSVHS